MSDTNSIKINLEIVIKDSYAWKLENIQILENPVKVSGKQGLWNWEKDQI